MGAQIVRQMEFLKRLLQQELCFKERCCSNNMFNLTSSVSVNLCLTPVLGAEGKIPHGLWFEAGSIQLYLERHSIEQTHCNNGMVPQPDPLRT